MMRMWIGPIGSVIAKTTGGDIVFLNSEGVDDGVEITGISDLTYTYTPDARM